MHFNIKFDNINLRFHADKIFTISSLLNYLETTKSTKLVSKKIFTGRFPLTPRPPPIPLGEVPSAPYICLLLSKRLLLQILLGRIITQTQGLLPRQQCCCDCRSWSCWVFYILKLFLRLYQMLMVSPCDLGGKG